MKKFRNCVTYFVDPTLPSLEQTQDNIAIEIGKRGKKLSIEGVPPSSPANISPIYPVQKPEKGGW
jgi:hypothetical protein